MSLTGRYRARAGWGLRALEKVQRAGQERRRYSSPLIQLASSERAVTWFVTGDRVVFLRVVLYQSCAVVERAPIISVGQQIHVYTRLPWDGLASPYAVDNNATSIRDP